MSETQKEENTEISYNGTALEIINSLTPINQSIVFEADEDDEEKISVKASDSNRSIAYIFTAPKEAFEFTGDDCSFYNYTEFYNLFSLFEDPVLEQDDVDITINEGKQKLNYRLTDRELIKKTFNKIKFEDADTTFTMDADLVKKIKSLSAKTATNAERVKFMVEDEQLTYVLYNPKHHITFEDTFDVDNTSGEDFVIEVAKTIFDKIPLASYKVEMKEEGLIRFSMIREDEITVDIFTADMED
jgi:hypothetical protein